MWRLACSFRYWHWCRTSRLLDGRISIPAREVDYHWPEPEAKPESREKGQHEKFMSRIHEALKKAAQERSAQLAAGGEPTFLEVADSPSVALPLREVLPRPQASHAVPMDSLG